MKIIRHNNDALTIVDFPWLIGAIGFPVALRLVYEAIAIVIRGGRIGEALGAIVGALLFFFLAAIFTQRALFRFDLRTRQLTWSRRGLFGKREGILAFDQIRSAVIQTINSDDGLSYRVALVTQSGELPLTAAYDGNEKPARSARDAINQALDVDVASPDENDVRELARSGRTIDAIALARARCGYDLTQAKQFVEDLLR